MPRFYTYTPIERCPGIFKNTGFSESMEKATAPEMLKRFPNSIIVKGYHGDRVSSEVLSKPLAVPEGTTDWIDTLLSEAEVRFYQRTTGLGMNLLMWWNGETWQMCSYLPWDLLQPIASFPSEAS